MSPTEENRPAPRLESDQLHRFQQFGERLRLEFGDDLYSAWFNRLELLRASDGEAMLAAPTKFMKVWIDAHFLERLRACFAAEFVEIPSVSIAAPRGFCSCAPVDREAIVQGGSIVAGD
jgi:chromosomal replication initiator protein